MPTPLVSVIIATYNRAYILGECLESLACQTAPADTFEVIVVDNNSTDNTEALVTSFMGKVPGLRQIKESEQGLSFARNSGMAVARGDWIVCLDSDAKAHTNWVDVIVREIGRGNFDCFGGPYYAWHHYGPPPAWFASHWETSLADFIEYRLFFEGQYPTGGNCAFKKSLALELGGFPTDIGMTGNKCAYGEESKLFHDMCMVGGRLGSVPDMEIDHCVLPYKYTMRWRLFSPFAQGRDAPHPSGLRNVVRECWHLSKRLVAIPLIAWKGGRERHPWQRIVLECATPVLWRVGALWGLASRLWKRKK